MNEYCYDAVLVGYTMETMFFSWLPDTPVEIEKNMQMPQFTLKNHTLHDCSQVYTAGTTMLTSVIMPFSASRALTRCVPYKNGFFTGLWCNSSWKSHDLR